MGWLGWGVCLRATLLSSFAGTTWMQEILTLIYSKGDPEPAKSIPNWARAPWLEHVHFKEMLRETEGPRLLTTHMPWKVLAAALREAKPKVGADGSLGRQESLQSWAQKTLVKIVPF